MSLIVCESTGRWAAGLRKELPHGVSLVETRSLGDLWQQLAACPSDVIVLELTAEKIEPTLAALLHIGREFPQAISLVLADRTLSLWEDVAREAGAVHFIASPRRLPEVGAIVQRRMRNLAERGGEEVDDERSLEERILATLPWAE